jgi:capsid assembly protease
MARDFRHVLACVHNTPLAILPAKLADIEAAVRLRLTTGPGLRAWDDDDFDGDTPNGRKAAARRDDELYERVGDVAVIPVMGTITQRPSIFTAWSGACSAEVVGRAVDAAANDRTIRAILLDVDTPGGSVYGVPECAAKISAAAGRKKVVAVANPMIASAGYWLASQATEVVVTPSGDVGCVGVIGTFVDHSKADEEAGYKYTHIHAGRHKAEMYGTAPLSADTREYLQQQVDAVYAMMVRDIAAGRRTTQKDVRENFGEGRMLLAADAIKAGLADRIGTFDEVLNELVKAGSKSGGGTRADALRREISAQLAENGLPTA